MAMNSHGGGANTNRFGLKFEQDTKLEDSLRNAGYTVVNQKVYSGVQCVALVASKHELYRSLLAPNGIDWREQISKKLLPDEALYVFATNTVFIIEKKFQRSNGSVDEKLQTCDFKKRQYEKLLQPLGVKVEYLYVCNDWFRRDEYRDVHRYIEDVGCQIFFNEIPVNVLFS